MRDVWKPCQHALSDVVYKDVVVIGNGPSGMVTSFMLAGNIPHLKHIPDDAPIDEMLKARLSNLPPGQNLLETDLIELAEGLEGRSQNPIPLLMDNLLRPGADMGLQGESLIEWRYDVEKQIDHVVLGKGPPGGAWQTFPGGVQTLSPGAWLSLPPHEGLGAAAGAGGEGRVSARAVAAYCRRYVNACNLQRYFRSCVLVSAVTCLPRPPGPPCGAACHRHALFSVAGYDKCEGRAFKYVCRRVVLAGGGGDRPNTLPSHLAPHTVSSLAAIERALAALANTGDEGGGRTVVVVGSGVSAADAVRLARCVSGLTVRHVHRTPADALAKLSPETYPDYFQIYKMMCEGPAGRHHNYTSHPEHVIVDITPLEPSTPDPSRAHRDIRPKRVKLLNLLTDQTTEFTASLVAVLIGSKPDLFYLQTNFNEHTNPCRCHDGRTDRKCFLRNHWHFLKSMLGQSLQSCKSRLISEFGEKGLTPPSACRCDPSNPYAAGLGFGVDPEKPVDGRSNPLAIDKSTHELLHAPRGVYALGPLTADNFVRFIPGGALAVVAHMHRDMKTTE